MLSSDHKKGAGKIMGFLRGFDLLVDVYRFFFEWNGGSMHVCIALLDV
jgi:hypothetical protein